MVVLCISECLNKLYGLYISIVILLQGYYSNGYSDDDKKPFRTLACLVNFSMIGSIIIVGIILLIALLTPGSGSGTRDCEPNCARDQF